MIVPRRERADRVTAIPTVDLVYRFNEMYPSFDTDLVRQALLPLRIGHDVGEEYPCLAVHEVRLINAF